VRSLMMMMMMITPKHVGAVLISTLMQILKIFFKTIQLCISWWIKKNFDF
jgi:hypothetical protein